ncbi:glycosyltransferase family 4 protein [Mycobacterium sp. C3-094]
MAIIANTGRAAGCYDAESLAAALSRRDHEVRFITASPVSANTGDYRIVRIPDTDPSPRSEGELMSGIAQMGRFLVDEYTDEPPDVVHCHGLAYGMAAALAANRRPVATVQTFSRVSGERSEVRGSETTKKLETLLARNATMVTAPCSDDMQRIIRLGASRRRVSVLPCGIDVDAFHVPPANPDARRHRIVALVDDLGAPRGVAALVAALPGVPSADLVVLGAGASGGAGMQELLTHAQRLGVGDRIRVAQAAGDRDVAAWLASADVAVCPSPEDPDPRLALMAMACGVAVVAVEAGGARDAVIEEVTGLLVPHGHPQELSRALRAVLAQNVLRQGMGLAGRARARSRYCWDRVATDAEAVYESAARRATISV